MDDLQSIFFQVQSDHYEEFFSPELDKHGYYGLYKRKTNEVVRVLWFDSSLFKFLFDVKMFMVDLQVYSGNMNTIDGCATFFRRDRFSHVKKYEVEIFVCISVRQFSLVCTQHKVISACVQVEFNKAAQSLTDAVIPTTQKKTALNRLVKVAYCTKNCMLL